MYVDRCVQIAVGYEAARRTRIFSVAKTELLASFLDVTAS
jgi:hypothetical protein